MGRGDYLFLFSIAPVAILCFKGAAYFFGFLHEQRHKTWISEQGMKK